MSTLRELVAKWREIEKELITHVPGMERHIELREGRRIGLLLDELAAALVAEGQGAPDFAALPYKLTVDLSNYLENHRDCLPKTIALRRDIEFIVKVAMKEVAERAAAPSLHLTPAKIREAIEASWNAGFPFVPGITDEQIQFITDRLNGENK